MELNDLKKNMSVLEEILSKTNTEITIDRSRSETARMKLIKTYKQNLRNCLLVAIIPFVLLVSGTNTTTVPLYLKWFLIIYLLTGAIWYGFILIKVKKIDIASMTPIKLFSSTSKLRLYTLSGEIFFITVLAVFFSLFLSNLWNFRPLIGWLIIGVLIIGIILTLTYYLPKLIRLFRELESIQ